jgi:MFS transporter, DHA3 family, tetracycline resistance protein
MSFKKHKPIQVYLTIRFLSALFFAVIVTVNLVYQATVVGLNPLQLVLVGTLLETVSFLFEIPTGVIADVYSRKISVMIGLALIGLGFTVEGLFPFFSAVLIAQVIWGIGYTFVSGAREAWIADEIGEDKAGIAFSKGAQISLFGAFIGIVISILLANVSIRLPIVLGGILYSLQSVYLLFFMPEDNFHPTPFKKRESFKAMRTTLVQGIKLIRLSPVLLIIVVTGLIFGMFSEGFDRLWTPFMINNIHLPSLFNLKMVTWFGVLAMVANILSILFIRYVERRTDTNNHNSTVTTLFTVSGLLVVSLLFFGITNSFVFAAIGYWLVTMFKEARNPLYDAWVNQNLQPKVRATVFSICDQANSMGQIIGGPILGLIATVVSIRLGIILSGLLLIPTLFMYVYSIKEKKIAR